MDTQQLTLPTSTLTISFDGISDLDATTALTKLRAAVDLICTHASKLDSQALLAIGQITQFTVTGSHACYLGETSCHGETLSTAYIAASSPAWLASLFAHEGQHSLNRGKYHGDERWLDEKSAGTTQLSVGRVVGFSSGEINYLERWITDSNQAAMQQHMQQGFTD
jgi:hypothetical protein